MSKNIVVFSDGTAKEGGQGPNTNVYKLFNMIEDRTWDQIAFYDRGLGTGLRKFTGSAFGVGISKNIRECYEFIFENYQSRDQIYLFGFSRGAFTVRSLSGFFDLFGILPKSRRELFDEAYQIYKIRDQDRRKARAKVFLSRHHTMRCEIKFLGVWDTVGALGLPVPVKFLSRIHRKTTLGTVLEEARGCSSESGIMVLEQKTAWKQGAPNRCCHRTIPTGSASSLMTTAWWPMPACSCRPPSPSTWA